MKKSNLIKIVSILLISIMVILFTTAVRAADDGGYNDLTSTLTQNNANTSNISSNNTNTLNTNTNTNFNVNKNTNSTNTSSSIYNNTNTNLPDTGIGDSIPLAVLIVIFGISAVYAYKKIKEYKNF